MTDGTCVVSVGIIVVEVTVDGTDVCVVDVMVGALVVLVGTTIVDVTLGALVVSVILVGA